MDGILIWLLLFPIVWPLIAKLWLHHTITWQELALNILVPLLLVPIIWYTGKYRNMHDFEIWNGAITSKTRDHGSYIVPYPCNCRSCGKNCTTCSTCYEDRYTVTWSANTTVGKVTFSHLDWTSSSVYKQPDPVRYTKCKIGEPASLEKPYTNYVKAVPESLFHLNPLLNKYEGKIPAYPRVFDYYHVNRVLAVDTDIDTKPLNDLLNQALIQLGPEKQSNFVVILTGITDPNYRFAVENQWLAGKKNDVILYIGLEKDRIVWTDTTVWVKNTGNEMLAVALRDAVQALKTYDPTKVASAMVKATREFYNRPQMAKFEYLLDEIDPPTWAITLCIFISIFGSLGLSWVFHKNDWEDVDTLKYY